MDVIVQGDAKRLLPRIAHRTFASCKFADFSRFPRDAKPLIFASGGIPSLALEGILPFTKPVATQRYDLSIVREHQWTGVCVWMGFHPATANFYSLRQVSGEAKLHVFEVERH